MAEAADRIEDLVDLAAPREITRTVEGAPPAPAAGRPAEPDRAGESLTLVVDLGVRFPIHAVSVSLDGARRSEVVTDLRLAFSQDGSAWSEPPIAARSAADREIRAVLAAGEGRWTRHVRAVVPAGSASARARLHVWCEATTLDLIVFRAQLGVAFNILHEHAGAVLHTSYSLVSAEPPRSKALVGIALLENGAFGNCLVQYAIAIAVARALRLTYVKIPKIDRSQVIFLKERLTCAGITFIPADEPLPDDGYFLSGMFFDTPFQPVVDARDPLPMRAIVHTYIRPLFNGLPAVFPAKPEDELIIHIRSGDIFSTWVDPHYPQPPLAFYRMVIDRLLAEGRIRSVKLVFENRLNPVIAEVEAYAARRGLPVEIQSESLISDVAALVNGRYLVFGLGTFGPGICHLSDHVEQVFYFASNWPQGFQSIPTIGKVVEVRDLEGRYMKVGEWQNTDAQRRTMVDYPAEALAFDDA